MKNGFTLAEVLVTLGIIGVVSAMTIPTLIKNHQRNVYVSQLQKVYAELSQAFDKVLTDNNAISLPESKIKLIQLPLFCIRNFVCQSFHWISKQFNIF